MNIEQLTKERAESYETVDEQEIFTAGAEWERQRDKWRYPPDLPPIQPHGGTGFVIICYDTGKLGIGFYDYDRRLWNGFESNVIAWQPFPEPPAKPLNATT